MHFLADMYVQCEECKGLRYNRETMEILYRGKTISEILELSIEETLGFFANHPQIKRKLETLNNVGLGYIHLGQQATTLSGGESQRVKLAAELSRAGTGRTLYLLDEPTTGLHFEDVKMLLHVLHGLVGKGNTVVVIEHDLITSKLCSITTTVFPFPTNPWRTWSNIFTSSKWSPVVGSSNK
jgi:excinuclease ABC subunit A